MAIRFYLFIFFLISAALGQVVIGDWDAYTSPLKINKTILFGDSIICATNGGLMIKTEDGFNTLTTINNLYGVDLSTVEKDNIGNIWIGGSSPFGFIQIYNFKNGSVDIFDFGLTEITNFYIDSEDAYASFVEGQDVGVIKFGYANDKWTYRDIYRNFPAEIDQIKGLEVLKTKLSFKKNIFIATNVGLFLGDISKNLKDPNNWERGFCCFDDGPINAMMLYQDGIAFTYSQTDNDSAKVYNIYPTEEFYLSRNLDISLPTEFDEMAFDLDGYLVGIKNKKLYSERNDFSPISQSVMLNDIAMGFNQEIIISSDLGLLFLHDNLMVSSFVPNAPASSKFTAIEVLNDGRIVVGHNDGLSIKGDEGWRNILELKFGDAGIINDNYDFSKFVSDTIAFDFGEKISDIEEGPDGLLYIGIDGTYPQFTNPSRDGGGILIIDIDDPENFTSIDTSILGFYGSSGNGYHVVKDLEFDDFGNLWVANSFVNNKNTPLHLKKRNGDWISYKSENNNSYIAQSPVSLTIDSFSRIWISAIKADGVNQGIYPNGGLFFMDQGPDSQRLNSYEWITILSNESVWSVESSKNSKIFFLSSSGLNVLNINAAKSPILSQNSFPYFPNIAFGTGSKLKVDKQDNIWLTSPTQGVHVLLENSTYWPDINGIREYSSPLLSDQVNDIDFDEKNNLVYFATNKGISVLKIPFGNEKSNFNNLKIFPSPFIVKLHEKMIIDGLLYNSSAKIMTLDGLVIRTINSAGYQADGYQLSWDGKDDKGKYVSSGVYLVSIYSSSKSIISKIAVRNK